MHTKVSLNLEPLHSVSMSIPIEITSIHKLNQDFFYYGIKLPHT